MKKSSHWMLDILVQFNNLVEAFGFVLNHELTKDILRMKILGTKKYASDPFSMENLAIMYWFAEEKSKDEVCLDLGCGVGVGTILLSQIHPYVLGLDESLLSLNSAKTLKNLQKKRSNVDFILADLYHLPLRSNVASLVVCSHVLEHLKYPSAVLVNIRTLLKDSGVLIVSLPTILWELQFLLRRAKSMFFGLRLWDAKKLFSDFHINKWSSWRWEMEIKKAKFSILVFRGYYFLPIRRMSNHLSFFLYIEDILFDKFPWKYFGLGMVVKCIKQNSQKAG